MYSNHKSSFKSKRKKKAIKQATEFMDSKFKTKIFELKESYMSLKA